MNILKSAKFCLFAVAAFSAIASPAPLGAQTTGTVTGTVVDASSQRPLAGASVLIVGTARGTLTDANGRYLIAGIPAGAQRVRAALLGYGEEEAGVTVAQGATATADFALAPEALQFEEVVAIGYGTQRRRDVTGAISSVETSDIATVQTASSAGQLLQGRAPGVQVVQNNGAPGGGISIRVRGSNSITANSEPLYVIDGMPAYVGSGSQDPYDNPLTTLSPQDIESIEVLKDASATAIYGSRGANGVVLITTRKGTRGQNGMNLESSYGVQSPAKKLDLLNGRQFAELANEALINSEQKPAYTAAEVQALGEGTDWQSLVLRDAPMQSHTLTFSGGSDQTRYLITGNYFGQTGVVVGSAFERYSARVNIDQAINSRLRVGTNFTASNTDSDLQITDNSLGNGTVMGALWFNPASPVRNPETGGYVITSPVTWPVVNPVALARDLLNQRSLFAVIGNVFGEFQVLEGLSLRSSVGVTSQFERTRYFAPRTTAFGLGNNGSGSESAGTSLNLVNENIFTYDRQLRGTDNLTLTGGFTVQTFRDEGVAAANSQFANDNTGVYDLGAGTLPSVSSSFRESALLSYLGRANYSLLDRYILTVTGRFDGSSRFGVNDKWGFFPSAAFAWRVLDEPFLRDQGVFDDLKVRIGYGVTGNQEIGLYQSLARLSTDNYTLGGSNVIGYTPAGSAPNPNLKWETTRQVNAGVDFGIFGNRVTGSVDTYRSTTDDLLVQVGLPSTSGFDSQLQNIGSVENNGVEFALKTVNVQSGRVSWSSQLNLAANRNNVVNVGVSNDIAAPQKGLRSQLGSDAVLIRVGEPIGSFIGYKTNGIYQAGDACPLTVKRKYLDCVPGEYRYVDSNGDGRINAEDRVLLGNAQPDFYGGFTNQFRFGPLDLNVFLQGSYGGEVLNAPAINNRRVNPLSNQRAEALRRWTSENPSTEIPRANAARPRELYDVSVEDGSYLRLQDLTLGYQLPAGLLPGTSTARLYVTGQNLHVWTSYTGYDPEVNSFGGSVSRGIDLGAYPRPRAWNVGVTVSF